MILHGYFRSAAAFRVRIALNLKGLRIDHRFVHLRLGEQRAAQFRTMNPQGLVPVLETGDDVLSQSLAIIEYLEETRPTPALLPRDPADRARVRGLAQLIACDTHPLGNLRVLEYLRSTFRMDEESVRQWYNHWIGAGLEAFEARLEATSPGPFCHGDAPGLADICLVPQFVNATRFGLDTGRFRRVRTIAETAMRLPAFADAMPSAQPDAE